MHAFQSDRTFALTRGCSLSWEVVTRYGPFGVGSVETIPPVKLARLMHPISAQDSNRLLKNAHLWRYPHSSSLRRTSMGASLFGICPQKTRTPHPPGGSPVSGALHLDVFEQSEHRVLFSNLLKHVLRRTPSGKKPASDIESH